MFKYFNPRRFYHAVGKKNFWEFVLLAVFVLFFYGPLINMLMLAFADTYDVPAVLPQQWGVKWWQFVFAQKDLVSSMVQSFVVAILTTAISMVVCIPAAYSIARFKFPGRKGFMLSFLLTNAFPKLGIYTSIAILFYKYNLMGTLPGVIIIHMINSIRFIASRKKQLAMWALARCGPSSKSVFRLPCPALQWPRSIPSWAAWKKHRVLCWWVWAASRRCPCRCTVLFWIIPVRRVQCLHCF